MKHLVRLYPKGWRNRYGAELAALIQQRRATIGEGFDLVRGALDAHLHPSLGPRLVFVPEFGFRAGTTRVLGERVHASVDRTSVTILAVAAGPDRTDLLFEWEPPEEPEGRDSWLLRIDRSGVHQRPPAQLDVALIVGRDLHAPLRVEHRFRHASGYDLLDLTFPAIAAGTSEALLEVRRATHEWRVPFRLAAANFLGSPAAAETEHEGIRLRATAVARQADEVVVGLEAATKQEGTRVARIGSGDPSLFPRRFKMPPRRTIADPLRLKDAGGRMSEELRRLHHFSREPDLSSTDPWPSRITSVFGAADPDARTAVLTVPSMLIDEAAAEVVVDLRTLPTDIQLGAHRIRVLRAEDSPVNRGRRRIVFQLFEPAGPRHFLGPASLRTQGWPADHSFRGEPDERQQLWMDTIILDVPIVTLAGAVVRVDGPWTLDLSLD
jgi:hypothetical protein